MTLQTTLRGGDLMELSALLTEQQAAKYDVVAPADSLRTGNRQLFLTAVTDLGVEVQRFNLSTVAIEGLADKLDVPVTYLRRLHNDRPDLFDANVNGWLHGGPGLTPDGGHDPHHYAPDSRKFLVRAFKGENGHGLARAILSDGYRFLDHVDALTALLEGARAADQDVKVENCHLTERRMYVELTCPQITALAPTLLANYRSPFDQGVRRPWDSEQSRAHGWYAPDERPIVFAGLVASNSETGDGAWTLSPRIVVRACKNGMTITADQFRQVHLGARLDEGIVNWSEDTQEANLTLITNQAKDAVTTFLSEEYLQRKVDAIEAKAGHPIHNAEAAIREVTQNLRLPEARRIDVLAHFILGGQMTAGGVLQAMTSVAQTLPDADEAAAMEAMSLRALDLAAAI